MANVCFNPELLLPASALKGKGGFVNYRGSLTTPPCTEGVDWVVFSDPVPVAGNDVLDFLEFAGNGTPGFNARPLQPLNDREMAMLA
jgi:carbonic anhydrase